MTSTSSSTGSGTPDPARIAVVTGAGRGIGAAIAARLQRDGFRVVRLDVDSSSSFADVIPCDISDAAAVDRVADHVEREFGPVSVLVNNAGAWSFGALEDVTPEEFARTLAVNVSGTFHCTRAFGRSMLASGGGSIVNIVSIAAQAANPKVGAYSASKAGVVALTRQTALEWGPRGVRANAVGPGFVPTPGTGTVYDDPAVREVRAAAVPLRRLGEPDDVANVVSFLASDQAGYVNGQVIYVDGGFSEALMTLVPRPPGIPGP
ncbi:MAG: 2-deoxy-D-gluconate 3-dehydrogenase [Acidimicrobiales bacterium mtb01]|nr:SDR family oxidoreductase [Actinomycetota bacterium]TEX44803.1 MAG: 2-deoxy-D-gluconate 3-dehydrogenase [Acidimicrobiales bacterium mtb01]